MQQLLILNRSRQQSPNLRIRSAGCRFLCSPHSPHPSDPVSNRSETFDSLEPPSDSGTEAIGCSSHQSEDAGPVQRDRPEKLLKPFSKQNSTIPRDSSRIAQQIALPFDIQSTNRVQRILASHYRPAQGSTGPCWLTVIGLLKDSLWSICSGANQPRNARLWPSPVSLSSSRRGTRFPFSGLRYELRVCRSAVSELRESV